MIVVDIGAIKPRVSSSSNRRWRGLQPVAACQIAAAASACGTDCVSCGYRTQLRAAAALDSQASARAGRPPFLRFGKDTLIVAVSALVETSDLFLPVKDFR